MPSASDRREVLSDALPRLAGPAGPDERAALLIAAVQALTGLDAAAVIIAADRTVEAVAGSDEDCRRIAQAWDLGTGPPDTHLPAAGRGAPTLVPMTDAGGAGDTGPALLGALLLLPRTGRTVTRREVDRVSTLTAVAAAGLLQYRALLRERRTTEQLSQALESRVVIEQAKGVLAERGGIDPDTAFDRLRRCARAQRLRLQDLAYDVVRGDAADAVLAHVDPDRP